MFSQVTILAPGLLGASLGRVCHARRLAGRVVVWARRAEARERASAEHWCRAAPEEPGEAVAEAELVVLCPPVAQIVPMLERIAPHLRVDALVTDVGSTKARICAEAPAVLPPGPQFVGAHPMAGSEKSGMEHARTDLFDRRPCFLTPREDAPPGAVARIHAFWEAVGMEVHRTTPEEHDRIVAEVSHLPHLVASALSASLARNAPGAEVFGGGGLHDTTRVAAGNTTMWRSICEHNRHPLQTALSEYRQVLDEWAGALQQGDFDRLEALLEEGRRHRLTFPPDRDD